MVSVLIGVIAFVGNGVTSNVEALRETMSNVNETLAKIRVEMGKNEVFSRNMLERQTRFEDETNRRMSKLWDMVSEDGKARKR
jgi:uncharacterized protein YoxC